MAARYLVVTGRLAAGWARRQSADLAEGLRAAGRDAALVNMADLAAASKADPAALVISGNARGFPDLAPEARMLGWMVDHPCARIGDLDRTEPHRLRLGWVCQSHIDAAAAMGFPFQSGFLPHAGGDPMPNPSPMRDRDIDILFAGALYEPFERPQWAAQNPDQPAIKADILFDAVDAVCAGAEALPSAVAACARRGVNIMAWPFGDLCRFVSTVIEIAEIRWRNALLAALPPARITVIANHRPRALLARGDISFLDYSYDFDTIEALMARSRVVINATAKFPRGGHERIWYAMAAGAVPLTDPSSFVAADFSHGREILVLPRPTALGPAMAELDALVHDPARLDAIAAAASGIYRARHTWRVRARSFAEAAA